MFFFCVWCTTSTCKGNEIPKKQLKKNVFCPCVSVFRALYMEMSTFHCCLFPGLYELTHDKITEHPSTINVLSRMNIYQEVLLGVIYRSVAWVQVGDPTASTCKQFLWTLKYI